MARRGLLPGNISPNQRRLLATIPFTADAKLDESESPSFYIERGSLVVSTKDGIRIPLPPRFKLYEDQWSHLVTKHPNVFELCVSVIRRRVECYIREHFVLSEIAEGKCPLTSFAVQQLWDTSCGYEASVRTTEDEKETECDTRVPLYASQKRTLTWMLRTERQGFVSPDPTLDLCEGQLRVNLETGAVAAVGAPRPTPSQPQSEQRPSKRQRRTDGYSVEHAVPNQDGARWVGGGVLADHTNSGKSAVVVALVLKTVTQRGQTPACVRHSVDHLGRIHAPSTLVVCPPQLCSQWRDEFCKFAGVDALRIVVILDLSTAKRATIETILSSDVVIVSSNFLAAHPSTKRPEFKRCGTAWFSSIRYKPNFKAMNNPPLTALWWDRIVFDEFQEFVPISRQSSSLAREFDLLRCTHPWCLSSCPRVDNSYHHAFRHHVASELLLPRAGTEGRASYVAARDWRTITPQLFDRIRCSPAPPSRRFGVERRVCYVTLSAGEKRIIESCPWASRDMRISACSYPRKLEATRRVSTAGEALDMSRKLRKTELKGIERERGRLWVAAEKIMEEEEEDLANWEEVIRGHSHLPRAKDVTPAQTAWFTASYFKASLEDLAKREASLNSTLEFFRREVSRVFREATTSEQCPVCLSEKETSSLAVLHCGHVLCEVCMQKVTETPQAGPKCPTCRRHSPGGGFLMREAAVDGGREGVGTNSPADPGLGNCVAGIDAGALRRRYGSKIVEVCLAIRSATRSDGGGEYVLVYVVDDDVGGKLCEALAEIGTPAEQLLCKFVHLSVPSVLDKFAVVAAAGQNDPTGTDESDTAGDGKLLAGDVARSAAASPAPPKMADGGGSRTRPAVLIVNVRIAPGLTLPPTKHVMFMQPVDDFESDPARGIGYLTTQAMSRVRCSAVCTWFLAEGTLEEQLLTASRLHGST
jgi:hypothetical protein